MSVTVRVGKERVTVSDDGNFSCTCGPGHECEHLEAVLLGDRTRASVDGLDEALKIIGFAPRLQIMTEHRDRASDPRRREALEAAIDLLLAVDHRK